MLALLGNPSTGVSGGRRTPKVRKSLSFGHELFVRPDPQRSHLLVAPQIDALLPVVGRRGAHLFLLPDRRHLLFGDDAGRAGGRLVAAAC
jgi:hypothetical protein